MDRLNNLLLIVISTFWVIQEVFNIESLIIIIIFLVNFFDSIVFESI